MSHAKQHGFTIIELMLAMSFLSILLMTIAMTTIQISNIYTKGITLREVNQVGRQVSDELQRSIASSSPFDVTPKRDDAPATATSRYVVRDGGGRLCLGSYTYAWNNGAALAGGSGAPGIYNRFTDNAAVRFVKVADPSGALCADPSSRIVRTNAAALLDTGDRNLVLHSFDIRRTANDPATSQAMYAITMVIGTNDRAQLQTSDTSCRPPASNTGSEQYCSVNQFQLTARAGNRAGGGE